MLPLSFLYLLSSSCSLPLYLQSPLLSLFVLFRLTFAFLSCDTLTHSPIPNFSENAPLHSSLKFHCEPLSFWCTTFAFLVLLVPSGQPSSLRKNFHILMGTLLKLKQFLAFFQLLSIIFPNAVPLSSQLLLFSVFLCPKCQALSNLLNKLLL